MALLGKEMLRSGPYLELTAVRDHIEQKRVGLKRVLCLNMYLYVLVELVHFNSLQWDLAERGASLEFKVENSYGQTLSLDTSWSSV